MEHILFLILGLLVIAVALFFVFKKKPEVPKVEVKAVEKKAEEVAPVAVPVISKVSWRDRLSMGLEKSRSEVWGKIGQLFSSGTPALDEIEEILYTADIPTGLVQELLSKLEKDGKGRTPEEIQHVVFSFMKEKMFSIQQSIQNHVFNFDPAQKKTRVFMIVGVNGAGKTTTLSMLTGLIEP
jgi:fused signal recognition particle receptor